VSTLDDALAVLASLVIEDGRRWGDAADEVQRHDARMALDPDSSTPYGYVTRARGYDKTAGAAGVAVAVLLTQARPGDRLYYLAADRDQGRLAIDSVAGYVARTSEILGGLVVDAFKVSAPRSGASLEVLAADAPSSFGLRPAFLVVDEIAVWGETDAPRRLFDATTSALAKVPGARCLVVTTAGDPSHWSFRVLEHARADPLWWVHEVPGPAPWADPARLAEQRRRLLPSMYARLFLNEWTSSEEALVDAADLAACVTHDGPLEAVPGARYVVGVDVGLRRDATAIAVAHAEGSGSGQRVVLDRMVRLRPARQSRRGSGEVALADVESAVFEASSAYGHAPVRLDPWQAIGMAQHLRARGVVVDEFTFSASSVGRLASTLHLLVRERRLGLPNDSDLLEELGRVRLRETSPGVVRLDHAASGHDDQAVALALAATALVEQPDALTGTGASYRPAASRLGRDGQPRLGWGGPRVGWARAL
jgi:hypothetical protein